MAQGQNTTEAWKILRELWKNVENSSVEGLSLEVQPIKLKILELQQIWQRIQSQQVLIEHKDKMTTSRMGSIIRPNEDILYYSFDFTKELGVIEKDIVRAYFLTEEILVNLRLIDNVAYSVVYNSPGGQVYLRATAEESLNILQNPENVSLEQKGETGIYRLALNLRNIRKELKKNKINNQKALNKHYKQFVMPLKKSKNFNTGYAAEAFERHWEELGHSLDNLKTLSDKDFGGEKHVWALYMLSAGRDPYFTGPDTLYSQVKRANASLISNINTIAYTVQGILSLVSYPITKNNLRSKIKQVFNQGTITEKTVDTLSTGLDQELIKDIKQVLQREYKINL